MRQAQNTGIVRSARQTRKIQAIAPEQPQSNTSGMPVMDRLYTTSAHTPAIPSQRAEPVRAALVSARTGSARSQSRVPRVQTPRRGKRTRGRGWVGITIALVCFILLSLIVGLNSSTLFPAIARILHPNTTNSVTIKTISEDYTFSTLNGQPSNLAQNQIAIYTVTTQSQSQPQTIQGTGHTHTQGTAAHGTLTFLNGKFVTQSVAPGTILTGKDGVKVITEAVVNIPPTDNAGNLGVATVAAHSIITGAKGNIAALDINQTCCDTVNSTIFVKNTAAFTGGQDAKDYAFIQQSDIDAVTNAQRNTLEQQAQKSLAAQVSGGQELLAGSVQCTTQASADQPVGDKGQNVTATKVTVTSTCRGTSYDKGTVKRLVTAGLQAQMAHRFGSGYVLQENSLQMQVTTANGANGLVLHVHATAVSVRAALVSARTPHSFLFASYSVK
jgi:hypothetical protein